MQIRMFQFRVWTPFCPEGSITLNAIPTIPSGASYLWSNSDNTSSTVVNTPGQVIVTVSYSNGCNTSDTVTATITIHLTQISAATQWNNDPGVLVNFTDMSTIASGT